MSNAKLPFIVVADTLSIKSDADPAVGKALAKSVEETRSHPNTCKYVTYERLTGDQGVYHVFSLFDDLDDIDNHTPCGQALRETGGEAAEECQTLARQAVAGAHRHAHRLVQKWSNPCSAESFPAPYLLHVELKFKCSPGEANVIAEKIVADHQQDPKSTKFFVFEPLTGSSYVNHLVIPLNKIGDIARTICTPTIEGMDANECRQEASKLAKGFTDTVAGCSCHILSYLPDFSNPPG